MKLNKFSLVAVFLLLFFGILQLTQTHELFFLTSSKEKIDFERATGNFDITKTEGTFQGKLVQVPSFLQTDLAYDVLGVSDTSNKRIEIDLANQRLYAFEGESKIYDFLISSGKWGRTPTGDFSIWIKLRYTNMSGGNKALGTYYYLPNVPFTMFFYNDKIPKWKGYGIHGTYWHSNFGHPMSHGCINMKTEEVEKIFYWAQPNLNGKSSVQATTDNPGTPVIIYGTAPNE